jgi:hypothetical protein
MEAEMLEMDPVRLTEEVPGKALSPARSTPRAPKAVFRRQGTLSGGLAPKL